MDVCRFIEICVVFHVYLYIGLRRSMSVYKERWKRLYHIISTYICLNPHILEGSIASS